MSGRSSWVRRHLDDRGRVTMLELADEELGPIDYMVVELPPGSRRFEGAMARELASLVEAELIRVLDLLVLEKDEFGHVVALELEDMGDLGALSPLVEQQAEILAAQDVTHLAAAMEPGSCAGVLVWENTWAAPFATAAREAGGQLIASGHIPTDALLASFGADEDVDTAAVPDTDPRS